MPYENITLTREKTIATLTMNRPAKMNTLSDGLLIDLQAAFMELESDTTIRAVVLTVTDVTAKFKYGGNVDRKQGCMTR